MTSPPPDPPAQRQVTGRIHTPSGWIVGTFHVPEEQTLLAFLNGTRDFFTLTDVQLPSQQRALPFLALQRTAATLIVPATDERIEEQEADDGGGVSASLVTHQVSCLLEGGVLMGTLRLADAVRVSDHLMANARFLTVRDCTIGLDRPSTVEAAPLVVVNAGRVVGVAEM